MPFYDLNIPYTEDHASLSNTLSFAKELGYETVALSIAATGTLSTPAPTVPTSTITKPHQLQLLTRLTLTISDHAQNHRIPALQSIYDIIALRPTDMATLQHCCLNLDCDVISIDFSRRLNYPIKFKTVSAALQRGIRFEICYSPGVLGSRDARGNLISGATQLIRATRGRGIVISSDANNALGLRGPCDVMNLAQVWGLPQQKAKETVCEEVGKVVRLARMKRASYKGVVDIVDGGSRKPASKGGKETQILKNPVTVPAATGDTTTSLRIDPTASTAANGIKRKASMSSLSTVQGPDIQGPEARDVTDEKPLSKNQIKKRAKKVRVEGKSLSSNATSAMPGALPLQHESLMPNKPK